ncbi:prolyl 3-hydroxylase sudestada1 isoform X1 [Contarinia nasturtii]|uniref:prolyl 3-hydroxylase sudestada1 isoform X1 n=1 Tax=Contarinia nasturtii TaxID=265458 RepID=UPI0012D4A092|nr:prolyl 3-hydroxylase sudestada1 isoform X1 [Contarinia nasturtii]
MADDSKENDQQKIDSAINELAERKNDVGSEKPSTSIPQKRPSPNSNVHQLSPKRMNVSSQHKSFGLRNESMFEPMIESSSDRENDDALLKTLPKDEKTKKDSAASCSQNKENDINQHASKTLVSSNTKSTNKTTVNFKLMSVNSCLTNKKFMDDFTTKWSNTAEDFQKFNNDSVKLYAKPFKICVLSDFLEKDSFTKQIVSEMSEMEWQRKQMDLYEFHQTTDLVNLLPNAKPALKSFYNMLLNNMLPWMKKITGLPLTRISASCSMYNYGDYLLVHDDLLSDRQIAFVFYLSPWCEEWKEEMGGALELFETDALTGQPKYPIVQKFTPRNNQFVFFRVCKESFHQVGEVTNFVYPRLTINGWFHGPSIHSSIDNESSLRSNISDASEENDSELEPNNMEYLPPNTDELDLNEWINSYYLRKRAKHGIQMHIEEKSEVSLEMFLISEFFELLVSEFKDCTDWVLEGPANQRKYESLHLTPQSSGPLKDLLTLFTSNSMFRLLHEYTELDLYGMHAQSPTCSVQLCRFTQGCYTLLGDSSSFNDSALDVILFFGARDGVGKITYLSPLQEAKDLKNVSEYNTTVETDATNSSMDLSGVSSPSGIKDNSSRPKTKIKSRFQPKNCKNSSESSINSSIVVETSEEESNIDDLSSFSHDSQSTVRVRSNDVESNQDEVTTDEDEEEDFDGLAQEDALLTIHPKDNALNLVYRLSGQTKFVKYISKNSLKSDEYVYILFASYKE